MGIRKICPEKSYFIKRIMSYLSGHQRLMLKENKKIINSPFNLFFSTQTLVQTMPNRIISLLPYRFPIDFLRVMHGHQFPIWRCRLGLLLLTSMICNGCSGRNFAIVMQIGDVWWCSETAWVMVPQQSEKQLPWITFIEMNQKKERFATNGFLKRCLFF